MRGNENLIPFSERTEEEQRDIRSKGGKASGEARRRRKALRESMDALLSLPPANNEDFDRLAAAGIDVEEMDNSQLVVVALFEKAKLGDVAAIKELRELIGEKEPERLEHEIKVSLEGVKEYAD